MLDLGLEGKVALITGGSDGLGARHRGAARPRRVQGDGLRPPRGSPDARC